MASKLTVTQVLLHPHGSDVGFKVVATDSEQALLPALTQQSVSIAIFLYQRGVLTAKCGKKLEHGVLSFGHGTDK